VDAMLHRPLSMNTQASILCPNTSRISLHFTAACTNRIHFVLFGIHNRTLGPYLAQQGTGWADAASSHTGIGILCEVAKQGSKCPILPAKQDKLYPIDFIDGWPAALAPNTGHWRHTAR
jgi:hypothetical protein